MLEQYKQRDEMLRYTHRLTSEIKSKRKRRRVEEEYLAHIEDAMYAHTLSGLSEEEAFAKTCRELGDEAMIQQLLATTHNKDPLPSYTGWLLGGLLLALGVISYILIQNRVFRSWMALAAQLVLLGLGVYGVYLFYRVCYCVRRRRGTLKKLGDFARENGLQITVKHAGMRGMFAPTEHADVVIDTPVCRYILSLWGTFLGKRHLHLTDIGLYMHSAIIGYANLFTGVHKYFNTGYFVALPKGLEYFSMFHTSLVDVPKGMHLLPTVHWEAEERQKGKNVRVLLLSPVPFKTSALVNGHENELMDGDGFEGALVYSTEGFLSYLNGERIRTDGTWR